MQNTDKHNKTEQIAFRVTPEQKETIEDKAKENGFDTVSSFLLWCVHNLGNERA